MVKNGVVQLFTGTESLQQVTYKLLWLIATNNHKQDGASVDDNEWHVIDIKFNRGSVSLKLDDLIEDYVSLIICPSSS